MHKVIRLPEVKNCTGLARSTIYKKMAERSFPLTIALGPKAVGWLEQEIQEWIQDRVRQSPQRASGEI